MGHIRWQPFVLQAQPFQLGADRGGRGLGLPGPVLSFRRKAPTPSEGRITRTFATAQVRLKGLPRWTVPLTALTTTGKLRSHLGPGLGDSKNSFSTTAWVSSWMTVVCAGMSAMLLPRVYTAKA